MEQNGFIFNENMRLSLTGQARAGSRLCSDWREEKIIIAGWRTYL